MSKVLFLDDNPSRISVFKGVCPNADIATTAEETINFLNNLDSYDLVSLDHDLNGEVFVDSNREDCGFEVVRWIIDNKPTIGKIIIHSHNGPAAFRMVNALFNSGYDARKISFGPIYFAFLGLTSQPPSL